MQADSDTVDLREVARVLRRGWRWIAGGALVGALAAIAATLLLPPRYESPASVLLRGGTDPFPAALSKMGGLEDLLPTSMKSDFETELALLTSRSVTIPVVDSLLLQARVLSPRGVAARALFSAAEFEPYLEKATYRFAREGDAYVVDGPRGRARAVPGSPVELDGVTLVLRRGALPREFAIQVRDLETTLQRFDDALEVEELGGDLAGLVFHATDRETAAAVPNLLIAEYLQTKKTTDRGVNQRRYEFLVQESDSVARELARAEGTLRAYQEQSGVTDPKMIAEMELEQAISLRSELEKIDVERRALGQMMGQIREGTISVRELAAYPTFLRSEAINGLLSQMLELESERAGLLQTRTPRDPEVMALTRSIDHLEGQLGALSASYQSGLSKQHAEVMRELGAYQALFDELPAKAERSFQLQRDVKRLSEIFLALQAQLVTSRLGAMTEGGEIRQVDVARPTREPEFPKPWLNLGIGIFAGVLFGVTGALGSGYLGDRVQDPQDLQAALGVPVLRYRAGDPLLLAGMDGVRGVLVAPIGGAVTARAVVRGVAALAVVRGERLAVIDLTGGAAPAEREDGESEDGELGLLAPAGIPADGYPVYHPSVSSSGAPQGLRIGMEQLERRLDRVVVLLPALESPATLALVTAERAVVLVGRAGELRRSEVFEAVRMLHGAGVERVGIVLQEGEENGDLRA